jgi:HAD superfamily hydrolase (TIGR01509 family)
VASAACAAGLAAGALRVASAAAALELEQEGGSEGERAARYLRALFLGAGLVPDEWPAVEAALYAAHRERHLWSGGDAGTGRALTRLRDAGVRLGVVSNSDGRVEQALDAAGLARYFDVIVDSRVAGVEKPDPRIFRAALDRLGVEPAAALYVGDVYEVDVVGARGAGLDAALVGVSAPGGVPGVACARTVTELVDTLLRTGQLPPSRPSAGA